MPSLAARLVALLSFVLLIGLPARSPAQTNTESNAAISFDFSAPGARNLGFAGAFTGLADDGTAAYVNPAGLADLLEPQLMIEGRYRNTHSTFTDGGRFVGEPTGDGIDTESGLLLGETDSTQTSLSYISYVHASDKWGIGVYRHQLLDLDEFFETQGAFVPGRISPVASFMDLEIVDYGVSGGLKITNEFMLGLGIARYEAHSDSALFRYDFDGKEPADFADSRIRFVEETTGDDASTGGVVGLLWKPTDKVSVGASFRTETEFELSYAKLDFGEDAGTVDLDRRHCDDCFTGDCVCLVELIVPQTASVGVVFRPVPRFTISVQADHTWYSAMAEQMTDTFGIAEGSDDGENRYVADDVTSLSLGFEYAFDKVAVRWGAWYDPEHKIRYEGENRTELALWQPGEDEWHGTLGLGVKVKQFQLDFAMDVSERVNTGSGSMTYQF